MTRAERYKLMIQAKEEGQAKEGNSFPKEVHPEYCTAEKGTPMLFRMMTFNSEKNPKTGYDHRIFYSSFLKDDEGKYFPFKWGFDAWYKHPIYELVKYLNTHAQYDLKAKEGSELLLDVIKNGDPNDTMSSGWKPSQALLANVIDRMDTWCKDNKHSKVATYKAIYDEENDRYKTDYGLKVSQYNEMYKLVEEEVVSLCDMDFFSVKHKTAKEIGKGEKEYYKTLIAETKKPYIEEHYGKEYVDAIFEDYDEEEMNYEMYNFDEMPLYKPSSMGYFLSKKSGFVKAVDSEYGTNFFEKFTAIANEEKKARGEEVEEATTTESKEVEKETPMEEPKATSRRSAKVETTEAKAFNPLTDLDLEKFKGISKMDATDLARIVGKDEEGNPIYSTNDALDECEVEGCSHSFPLDAKFCTLCGRAYE